MGGEDLGFADVGGCGRGGVGCGWAGVCGFLKVGVAVGMGASLAVEASSDWAAKLPSKLQK